MTITVGVVADIWIYREGTRALLARTPDIEVVAIGDLGETQAVLAKKPDIVIMDVACGVTPREVNELALESEGFAIVALGREETAEEHLKWFQAGVAAYLSRDADLEELVQTLEAVHETGIRISQEVLMALVKNRRRSQSDHEDTGLALLTPRETEVADWIHRGLRNKEIANQLHCEEVTVKHHVHNIFQKLNLHSRAEVAVHVAQAQSALYPIPPDREPSV